MNNPQAIRVGSEFCSLLSYLFLSFCLLAANAHADDALRITLEGRAQAYLVAPGGEVSGSYFETGEFKEDISDAQLQLQPKTSRFQINNPSSGAYKLVFTGGYAETIVVRVEYLDDLSGFVQENTVRYIYQPETSRTVVISYEPTKEYPVGIVVPSPPPGEVWATEVNGLISLDWEASVDPLVDSYRVYAKSQTDTKYTLLGETTTEGLDTDIAASFDQFGDKYLFAVVSVSADGEESYFRSALDNRVAASESPVDSGSIDNLVWADRNGDGIQGADEPGLAGVAVYLMDCDANLLTSQLTDGSGNYTFDRLPAGGYKVRVTAPQGYKFSPRRQGDKRVKDSNIDPATGQNPGCINLKGAANIRHIDAGLVPVSVGKIGDRVWADRNGNGIQDAGETGLANVDVDLLDCKGVLVASTKTGAAGKYLFDRLAAGRYKVRVTAPQDYAFSPFKQGAKVALDSNIDPATGTTPGCVKLAADQVVRHIDAGLFAVGNSSIGNRAWDDRNWNGIQDAGEPGLQGVAVQLLDCDRNILSSKTTNKRGLYTFNRLPVGRYKIRVTAPQGYGFSPRNQQGKRYKDSNIDPATGESHGCINLKDGKTLKHIDAGLKQVGTASIGNRIWADLDGDGIQDSGEPGLAGVAVELMDCDGNKLATGSTNAAGKYAFNLLPPGRYKVHVTAPSGYAFSPVKQGAKRLADSNIDPATGTSYGCINLKDGKTIKHIDAGLVAAKTTVFSDDFDDDTLDTSKWITSGNIVSESGGMLRLDTTVTDQGGGAKSAVIKFDPSKPLVISRRVNVYAANNYYNGLFTITPGGDESKMFGVSYSNYHYVANGECKAVGFMLFRNNANTHKCVNQGTDTTSTITPIWNTEFAEVLEYDPASGNLRYSIDGTERLTFNVGALQAGVNQIELWIGNWGWYTGHHHWVDDLVISQ